MSASSLSERRLHRERSARKQAESLLEDRSRELFSANQELQELNETLEQRVEERTRELVEAHEIAVRASNAKTEFLSSMSHELRTPLNAILGFSQLLEIDDTLDEVQQEYVSEVMKAGNHLLKLIDDVLDLARIEAGKIELSIEEVEIRAVMDECRMLTLPMAGQHSINLDWEECNEVVRADRTRFKQVLLNLVSNAIKYNRPRGSVYISCLPSAYRSLRIQVRDTGPGLSEEQQSQVFEPFNRLGQEGGEIEGTGIGLVIAKKYMQMMHGQIGVESRPEFGSTFWLELPHVRVESGREAVTQTCTETTIDAVEGGATILYIEDNPTNTRLLQRIIARKTECRLLTAPEPILGLDIARSHKPDLILLDINLPNMDGFEVLEHLQQDAATAQIPVVALSANAQARVVERGLKAGFTAYLTKPIVVNDLLLTLARYLPASSRAAV